MAALDAEGRGALSGDMASGFAGNASGSMHLRSDSGNTVEVIK